MADNQGTEETLASSDRQIKEAAGYRSDKERAYVERIAPLLQRIHKIAQAEGINMLAAFELGHTDDGAALRVGTLNTASPDDVGVMKAYIEWRASPPPPPYDECAADNAVCAPLENGEDKS